MSPIELMQMAVDKCREGIALGQTPFGCAIAIGDRVLAVEHNRVLLTTDITAHAEVTALREACREAESIFLEGAIVATTCEPCPMCMSALHWARVEKVFYGATIADANSAGFNELAIPATEILDRGGSPTQLEGGLLEDACRELFSHWRSGPEAHAY